MRPILVFPHKSHQSTVLIHGPSPSSDFLGMVSDHRLLAWFSVYASRSPSLQKYLSNPLHSLALPSLHLDASVIAATSHATVLDAMKLMSEEGVSSIAVVDEGTETLLSAVSVTDIGKVTNLSFGLLRLSESPVRSWFHQRVIIYYLRLYSNSSHR